MNKLEACFSRCARVFKPGSFCSGISVMVLALSLAAPASVSAGTWTAVGSLAPDNIDTMLLLSDGTVLATAGQSAVTFDIGSGWYKLTPDARGSYANGTWSVMAPMHDTRLYFSSQVLTNGMVFIAGGEYGTGGGTAELYDPIANIWTELPPSGQLFLDSESKMLPDGTVLVNPVIASTFGGNIIYNPALNAWFPGGVTKSLNEAAWIKLPDDSILSLVVPAFDPGDATNSVRYIPSENKWVADGTLPGTPWDFSKFEMGSGYLCPDGRGFYLGSSGTNVFYTPSGSTSPGTFALATNTPGTMGTADAPGAMMVDGTILCAEGPNGYVGGSTNFPGPTSFFVFDPVANVFTAINGPTGPTLDGPPFIDRMLDLPDGTVLFSTSSAQLYVYTPDGAPLASGKPTITSITPNSDGSYHLVGTKLNGISQGAAYGDDAQMDSNYPLVRLVDGAGNVFYARTFNWTSTGVQTGNKSISTEFTVPATLPLATFSLSVVANGIASDSVTFSGRPTPVLLVVTNVVGGGAEDGTLDVNSCNTMDVILKNVGSTNATGVEATLTSATPGVFIAQGLSTYPDFAVGATETDLTQFKVSVASNFVCGTPVSFTLVLKSDQTTQSRQFTVNTGSRGFPIHYDNRSATTITDNNFDGTDSVVVVNNFNSTIMHVAVSLNITQPFVGDLLLQLTSPDGTAINLSTFNGGLGSNYGTDCSDFGRTTFDDDALQSIALGSAPFIGPFQPSQPLATLIGRSGTSVNGRWTLTVVDPFGDSPGTLNCWSLILTPAVCRDGGGQCPITDLAIGMTAAPPQVVLGNNLTYTITVTNNGPNFAPQVGVNQTLPPNVLFVSANSSQGNCSQSSGIVSCNLGNMAVGATATETVVVFPLSAGTIFSTANVQSPETDYNLANNTITLVTVVQPPSSDMSVGITANPNPVLLGGIVNYSILVTNNGPSAASGVWLTNTLPAGASFISASSVLGTFTSVGNTVIGNLGSMPAGTVAAINIAAGPTVLGNLTDTVRVVALQADPLPANNIASVTTAVTPAADLVLTMTGSPSSAIVGSNIVYTIKLVNLGASLASGVVINDALPSGLTNVIAVCPNGVCTVTPGSVSCVLSNTLSAGDGTVLTITASTKPLTGQIPSNGKSPVTLVNTATVLATQADPNLGNNSVAVSTLVNVPIVNVVAAGTLLAAESFSPTNGMIDPGETVKVFFGLQNAGNITSTNPVIATLLPTGGVITNSGSAASFGLMSNGAPASFQPLTFAASAAYGGTVTASLQLSGGATNLVKFVFAIPQTNGFANTGNLTIPDHGAATPYPSVINVSGLAGVIGKVSVTLTNVNHTYPDDVDVLLVGPQGQNVLLESHAGGGGVLSGVSLTFDESATNSLGLPNFLPASSQIFSGVYVPSQYGSTTVTNLPSPAPVPPYGASLGVFDGTNPNGAWSLYVFDSSPGDAGQVVGGWSLNIESGNTVNPVADLAITGSVSANPVVVGDNLTYTLVLANNGPSIAPANTVLFADVLSPLVTFVSAASSQGVCTNIGGTVYCTLTNSLGVGSNAVVSVVVAPTAGAISAPITNQASVELTVGADDPNQSNNSISLVTAAAAPIANVAVSLSGSLTNVLIGSSNLVYTITVTNSGPGPALNVVLSDTLGGMSLLSTVSLPSLGSPLVTNGVASWNLGTLAPGTGVAAFLTVMPTAIGLVTNIATAATLSSDANPANNIATFVTSVTALTPNILPAGALLVSGGNAYGAIAPNQTVTVSLALTNNGSAATTNLQATLVAGTGVTPVTTSALDYGSLTPGGSSAANQFTFTASGPNGGMIAATLLLADQGVSLGTATFYFNLPSANTYANAGVIVINDHGPATPYPSIITVSGVTGLVSQATVTLNGFAHQFPNDVEALLVGPSGKSVVLMSGVGGPNSVSGLTLTFDDAASNSLPSFYGGAMVSGTYQPTDFGLAELFPSPAPAGAYGAELGSFVGASPNGAWSLFILDNSPGDSGRIAGGWNLNLTSMPPVNSATDLGASQAVSAAPIYSGDNFTFTIGITNKGPVHATGVAIADVLPAGLTLITNSAGVTPTSSGGTLTFGLGALGAGAGTNLVLTVTGVAGIYTNVITVSADQADFHPTDNTASAAFSIFSNPVATLGGAAYNNGTFTLTLTGQPGAIYVIQSSTDLSTWTPISTNLLTSPTFQFADTNAVNFPYQYYRAVLEATHP